MLFSAVQPLKALFSIVVTLFGMSMLCSDEQPSKAQFPIVVMLFGMSILCSALQPLYLQPVITQYFASNKSEIWS